MNKVKQTVKQNRRFYGAGDGTRTRDNLLGRQELYQLSYSRRVKLHVNSTPNQVKKQAMDSLLFGSLSSSVCYFKDISCPLKLTKPRSVDGSLTLKKICLRLATGY